jgi:capsular polysaccharide biosynthesis protein
MEIQLLIRIFRRRWWLMLIPVIIATILVIPSLLGSGSAVSGGYTTQIRYSAAQEFNLPERDGDYQDVWLASELTVNAFSDWIRSNRFRDEIQNSLGELDIKLGDLGIAADNARSVGVIYLSHPEQEELESIANTVMLVLASRNQEYFPQLGGESAVVTILDQPKIAPAPPPLTNRFAPLIRIAIALIVGLFLGFAVEYFDPTIHHQDELNKLGLPTLANIPKYKG